MPNTLPNAGRRPVVVFEVLVKQHNGQWEGRGTFAASERELAIGAARALEQDRAVALVKVVKETYDPATHTTDESTVYRFSAVPPCNGDTLQARRARAKAREEAERSRGSSPRRRTVVLNPLALVPALVPALVRALAAGCGRVVRRRRHRPVGANSATAAAKATTSPRAAGTKQPEPEPPCVWVRQKRMVMEFLSDVVDQVAAVGTGSDNDTRLGLCFYICGACEAVLERQPLVQNDATGFVAECLAVLRLPRQRALQFAADREGHVAESPRFRAMFQIGHGAMSAYLRTSASSADSLNTALHSWSAGAPQVLRGPGRHVAIVVTEIVLTSDAATAPGDDCTASSRRVHDRVVESVLRQFKGVEPARAPRGMTAVFGDPAAAVKCAVLIQRCIEDATAGAPEPPLSLRIAVVDHAPDGGRAASPTAAVELARTMIAAAEAGRIVCTDTVRRTAEALNLPCSARVPLAVPNRPEPLAWCEVVAVGAAPAPRGSPSPRLSPARGVDPRNGSTRDPPEAEG